MNTPFLDEIYKNVDFDRKLVYKFFTVFSLFEYALKQAGYLSFDGKAQPNWTDFAKSIDEKFVPDSSPTLERAAAYLMRFPPQKQKVRNGDFDFEDCPATENLIVERLSVYIRRVRNNLFHGAKFRYERPRDTELLQCSLIILESWAQLDERVRQALEHAK